MSAPTRRALLGLLSAAFLLSGCKERTPVAQRGAPAPELVAVNLDGEVVRLEQLRGKVVLINFWLAGCGPCLVEMPKLDAFYKAHRDEGFALIGVNMGQPEVTVKQAAQRLDVSFPMLVDRLKITTDRYNVNEAPTSFVIDAGGKLVERIYGPLDEAALTEKIGRRL